RRAGARQMIPVARGALGRRSRARADPDRRMGLLDRLRIQRHVAHRIMLALERHVILGEHAPYDLDALAQAPAAFLPHDIEAGELPRHVTLPESEVEAAVG